MFYRNISSKKLDQKECCRYDFKDPHKCLESNQDPGNQFLEDTTSHSRTFSCSKSHLERYMRKNKENMTVVEYEWRKISRAESSGILVELESLVLSAFPWRLFQRLRLVVDVCEWSRGSLSDEPEDLFFIPSQDLTFGKKEVWRWQKDKFKIYFFPKFSWHFWKLKNIVEEYFLRKITNLKMAIFWKCLKQFMLISWKK